MASMTVFAIILLATDTVLLTHGLYTELKPDPVYAKYSALCVKNTGDEARVPYADRYYENKSVPVAACCSLTGIQKFGLNPKLKLANKKSVPDTCCLVVGSRCSSVRGVKLRCCDGKQCRNKRCRVNSTISKKAGYNFQARLKPSNRCKDRSRKYHYRYMVQTPKSTQAPTGQTFMGDTCCRKKTLRLAGFGRSSCCSPHFGPFFKFNMDALPVCCVIRERAPENVKSDEKYGNGSIDVGEGRSTKLYDFQGAINFCPKESGKYVVTTDLGSKPK